MLKGPILLVEDSGDDALLVDRALARGGIQNELVVARTGEEALALLREGALRPIVVLLDLELPGLSGFEVLDALREDDETRSLPVAVLTGSKEGADVAGSYARGATTFFEKTGDLERLVETMRRLFGWLAIVRAAG